MAKLPLMLLERVSLFSPLDSWKASILTNFLLLASEGVIDKDPRSHCPGYNATAIARDAHSVTANLELAGSACNAYGNDISKLTLHVQCQTKSRLQVQIFDPALDIYQVPESVLGRPGGSYACEDSDFVFDLVDSPFSFSVKRRENGDVLFNTSESSLVFEDQYWRLRTSLPDDPNLYGLGEHTDSLRLNTTDYIRTLWNRDAGGVPEGQNIYGAHPVYFENRIGSTTASHGVALVNSNGMDIKIDKSDNHAQYLEYNVLGGIVDLYFLSGPTPFDVARQYSEVSGKPTMMPYWGLGFHNCRYGYKSVYELVDVVANYSKAQIPLETMWTDIDYMDGYKVFTLSQKFPLEEMRKLVDHLHRNHQHYVVMVDPAVAYQDYKAFTRGKESGVFLKNSTGGIYQGVVWPGVTAFPDWFNPDVQAYWNQEFADFFSPEKGVDIDALWIDMNEPANFCAYPCIVSDTSTEQSQMVQPGHKQIFEAETNLKQLESNDSFSASQLQRGSKKGLPDRNLMDPGYKIKNYVGPLSNHTVNTSVIHANGLSMYDTHNLYGTMMSTVSYKAMLHRRPKRRALVITRSTFMGAGTQVGHWLGDNVSTWHHYRQSIRHMLQFTAFFQMPMAGADICGFINDTTEELCARWTRLGAFSTFMRNHNAEHEAPQEFYRWPLVAESARKALDLRYRLLDYIYSAMQLQVTDGTPLIFPLWMAYPEDANTAPIELQFFFGPAFLISPTPDEGAKEVSLYLPKDKFYDLATYKPVIGNGSTITLPDPGVTNITVHIRGGNIIAMRARGANTTTQLREEDFELLVAPDEDDQAQGYLYLDDGDSLVQKATAEIWFKYHDGVLSMDGSFVLPIYIAITRVTILGQGDMNSSGGLSRVVDLNWPLNQPNRIMISKGQT